MLGCSRQLRWALGIVIMLALIVVARSAIARHGQNEFDKDKARHHRRNERNVAAVVAAPVHPKCRHNTVQCCGRVVQTAVRRTPSTGAHHRHLLIDTTADQRSPCPPSVMVVERFGDALQPRPLAPAAKGDWVCALGVPFGASGLHFVHPPCGDLWVTTKGDERVPL